MRVAYGVSVLAAAMRRGGADGIGNVTRELLHRLDGAPGLALLPFEYADEASGCIPGARAVGRFQPQAALSLATGLTFPQMQRTLRGQVDLVHATDHYVPRLRGVPVLATLMDAIPLSHPEWVAYRFKSLKNEAWRRSAHWADQVLTISEFSRQEIARWFRLPESRISVIPLWVDARWFETPEEAELERVRRDYALPGRFFLFVGTLQPRKNLERLVQAHAMLPANVRRDCPLIVAGRSGWGCEDLVGRLEGGGLPDVRWLSYVPDADLPVMLALATALVFPSLYEGFGLPVLEAFAAGTPVIASSAASVPEVAGDAALLADPMDARGWCEAMAALADDDTLAGRLRESGRARARLFSWDRTAAELAQLYGQVVGR
ncbi:glycosyltransferase family 4 protein [Aromatoleum aromaticum]|uniref:glycosyltransferase family 4 protein n=1 Tax=Aromatoleum aromaticum TaxID=551760 RepID=UPI0014595CEE|nr:glycosyltransferase family 1 protein [Aromatoleum aromaticum]NMG56615.1 glycosyltransferase [Aromatoleum aromaticum]